MPEIIPNLHPIFVHFTVGLLTMSFLLYIGANFLKNKDTQGNARTAALWMLWSGAVMTLFTVGFGFYAFNTVAHDDPSHLVMKLHRNLALGTATLFILLAGWSFMKVRKKETLPGIFGIGLAIGVMLLGVTAWHGGELVYRHGLGVMSLPESEGEGHSHEEGEGHDEAAMDSTAPPADLSNFDTATPAGTVNAFSAALKAGDGEAARSFLDDQVLIYESGYVERSAEEYAGHHMPADMKFVGAMTTEIIAQTETISGDMATVVSETGTKGTYNDKDYNLLGTGTMVLRRDGEGWKITHIHWSSRDAS